MVRAIIAGVDIGTTSAIAILNKEGDVLWIHSKKGIKKNEIIREIINFGKPIIIASDVSPLPKAIENIATKIGSKTFTPIKPLSIKEKNELTKKYSKFLKNNHEVSALAAAFKAWKKYRNLFRKVSLALLEKGLTDFFDDVVLKLLRKESENIENAIRKVVEEKKKAVDTTKLLQEYRKKVRALEKKLKEREKAIKRLKNECKRLGKIIKKIKRRKIFLEKSRFVKRLDRFRMEIEELKKANEFLKKSYEIEKKGYIPIIEIKKVDLDELKKIDNFIGFRDRVVYCNKTKKLEFFNLFKIKALIVPKLPDRLEILEFPVIVYNKKFERFNGIICVKKEEIENEIKKLGGAVG